MNREQREKLIEQYAAGPDEVAAALDGFPADGLTAHPIPGKWSAREIVHHLADSETTSALRLRRLIGEEFPVIHGYDQETFAVLLRYNIRDHGPSFDAFKAARVTTTQLLREMNDDEWKRVGWHTEMGLYPVSTWLEIYAVHAHNHAQQIRRLREALEKR